MWTLRLTRQRRGGVNHVQTRERAEKVYLTAAHERSLMGSQSPAPNTYGARSSFGGQVREASCRLCPSAGKNDIRFCAWSLV